MILVIAAVALLALLIPPLWLVVRLRRDNAAMRWWIALLISGVLGIVGGLWAGFFSSYVVNDRLRFQGFPVPFAVERLGETGWRTEGFAAPALVGTLDAVMVAGLALLPTAFLYLLLRAWAKATRPRPTPPR